MLCVQYSFTMKKCGHPSKQFTEVAAMANITKESSGKYRVLIRKKGYRAVSRTFTKKKDAEKWRDKVRGDDELLIAEGSAINRSMILAELIDEYIEQWQGRDKTTMARLAWWKDQYGQMIVGAISRKLINDTLKTLSNGRSSATVNRYKHALSGAFSYAVKELELSENPVRKARTYKEIAGRIRFLADHERKTLMATCKESEWNKLYLLVLLAITTGGRRGELSNIRWRDVDFERCTASIHHTKNNEPRVLPLTNAVISELKRHKDVAVSLEQNKHDIETGVTELNKYRDIGNSLVFASTIKPDKPFVFEKYWRKAMKDAEITNFRFHDLRHTAASYLAMAGATLHEIADVLGHKQIAVTMRYSHLCTDHKAKLINRVMSDIDG